MSKAYRILTLNAISARGLARLPQTYAVGGDVAEPDAILVRSHNMHDMAIPASVKAIGRAGAGTNNIPVKAMSERGVPVFNAPGANANAVKELVIAGMLMGVRNLVPAVKFGESLAESGRADAALAVWGPLGVFAVLCIWLFHGSLAWPGDNPISRASNRLGEGLQRLRRRLPGARK